MCISFACRSHCQFFGAYSVGPASPVHRVNTVGYITMPPKTTLKLKMYGKQVSKDSSRWMSFTHTQYKPIYISWASYPID